MANQMTPEEIQEIFEEYENQVKANGRASEEMTKRFKDAQRGVKDYTDNLKAAGQAFKSSFKDMASNLTDGGKGVGEYSDALRKGGDYIEKWASDAGPWGRAGALIVKGALQYAAAVAKQADTLFKGYQDISRAGATGAEGVEGLYNSMQKLGYGVEQLGDMAAVVKENSDSLAALGGTVNEGTKRFADMAKGIRDSDLGLQLEKMGVTVQEENKGIANYLKIQQITGQAQLKSQKELEQGAAEYLMQQERLTKLTGATADEQLAIREKAAAEERYGASQELLRAKNMGAIADRNDALNAVITKQYGEGTAQMFRNFSTGMMNSKEAQQFLRSFPDAARMIREGASMEDIQAAMKENGARTLKNADLLATAGQSMEVYGNLAEIRKAQAAKDLKDSEKQADGEMKVTDTATDALAKTARAQRDIRDSLQDLKQIGIMPVTKALQYFTDLLNGITGAGAGAVKAIGPKGAGGTTGPQSLDDAKSAAALKKISDNTVPANASDVDKVLATIRTRESGGNYAAQAKGSSASGAYQFIDSTWKEQAKKAGIGTEFKSAKDAPKEVQDAVAKNYVQNLLKQAGGDVSKVPNAWYTGNLQGQMSPQQLAANNGLTAQQYQANWMGTYNKIGGSAMASTGNTAGAAAVPAGPTSGYQNTMANTQAPTGPAVNQVAQAQQMLTGGGTSGQSESSTLSKHFAELNQTQKELLAVNKKILQRQS